MEIPPLYKKYHLDRDDERIGMFERIIENYKVQTALYPGSFVHFAPSFVIPNVVYVDSYKTAKPVFDDPNTLEYITSRKLYSDDPKVRFIHENYSKKLDLDDLSFDLLISQYGGIVSMHCKRYLKVDGLFVANNSHGDASMAYIDPDFEFIGVIHKRNGKYSLSENKLDEYFIPKKGEQVTKKELLKSNKGIGYTKSASNYLFRKVS